MKALVIKYKRELIGAALGAIAGWCYWYFAGCASGSCAITSSSFNSTLYGILMGLLAGSALKKKDQDPEN
jgi:hypothetical protein